MKETNSMKTGTKTRTNKTNSTKTNLRPFTSHSSKIDILDHEQTAQIFQSPIKEKLEDLQSPKRIKIRKSLAEKMREYGY